MTSDVLFADELCWLKSAIVVDSYWLFVWNAWLAFISKIYRFIFILIIIIIIIIIKHPTNVLCKMAFCRPKFHPNF